jgi:hypothetical protein
MNKSGFIRVPQFFISCPGGLVKVCKTIYNGWNLSGMPLLVACNR